MSCLRRHVYQSVHGQIASLRCFEVIHKAACKKKLYLFRKALIHVFINSRATGN